MNGVIVEVLTLEDEGLAHQVIGRVVEVLAAKAAWSTGSNRGSALLRICCSTSCMVLAYSIAGTPLRVDYSTYVHQTTSSCSSDEPCYAGQENARFARGRWKAL